MATQTENIGLTKPAGTEKYSLDVNNENLEKIDAVLGEIQEAVGTGSGGGLGDKVGNYDDTEAGTVFGDLNIIKEQTEQNGTDIAEVKQTANNNSDKLTALQTTAGNTKTVVDVVNTNTETVKQNTETLKTTANGISAKVDSINTNVSENGTKLDTLADKADVISGQVQTVGNNVNTANTNISSVKSTGETTAANVASVKTTVEGTDGKVDTLIANNRLKSFVYAKMPSGGSGKWLTVCEITGRGVIEKAIALAGSATGWQMRITVDDAVVYWSTANANSWIGVIKDCNFNNSALYQMAMNTAGKLALIAITIGTNGEWRNSFPGENNVTSCVAVVPGGIRFYKNFKVEMYNFTGAVTIGGEITETSTAVTL